VDVAVIVVGAGPTGLVVAGELGLAGVPVMVLEGAGERSRQSRAGGIQPRTAEVFEMRGLLAPMLALANDREPVGGHFAGLPVPLDCTPWQTRFPCPISIPQYELEVFLERRLGGFAGVDLRRGCRLVGLDQDADGVTATVAGPGGERPVRAGYLVGCDGGHSTVRRLAGVGFPGRPGRVGMVASDVRVSGVADQPAGHFSRYVRSDGSAPAILSPLGGGLHRFMFVSDAPRDAPVTDAEVAAALRAACGPDAGLVEVVHASRFSDASRLADRYRVGRVLLAGDAAHIHLPAGGQGINLGVQDAMNLGWKLAATVRGGAPDGLLDSYHDERHPVAARVLTNTRAQGVLMDAADPEVAELRAVFTDLLRLPDTNRYLAGMMSGLDTRYAMAGTGHPLLGARLPDVELSVAGDTVRAGALLHSGRGLLLDLGAGVDAAGWADRIDHVTATSGELAAGALLVRPDGHVAATDAGGTGELVAAMRRWFGAPIG
jgi:2-polyprenyl-6-methoxyphenol hydroxylase-like FAD-dependent oxidoreductase